MQFHLVWGVNYAVFCFWLWTCCEQIKLAIETFCEIPVRYTLFHDTTETFVIIKTPVRWHVGTLWVRYRCFFVIRHSSSSDLYYLSVVIQLRYWRLWFFKYYLLCNRHSITWLLLNMVDLCQVWHKLKRHPSVVLS